MIHREASNQGELMRGLSVMREHESSTPAIVMSRARMSGRPRQKEPEPRNRTKITKNRNRTNRTEGTVMKFGPGFLRTEINEIFLVLHCKA